MDTQSDSSKTLVPHFGDVPIESHKVPDKVPPDNDIQNSQKIMDNHQDGIDDGSEDSNGNASENGKKKKTASLKSDEMDEIRGDGSADDMDLEETIDSHIGVRMENERQHTHSLPSENEDEDEIGMDHVNILDSLPLEGAPIEGQEVSEADLLGKINDDEEVDEDEEKPLSRSGDEENLEGKKRRRPQSDNSETSKKKSKKDDEKDGAPEVESKSDKKQSNMRRNIREVMDETQLDEATLAAQRQEMERLRRVQEQQRIIREVQHRQADRGISLLRSNRNLQDSDEIRLPSSVQLRVNSSAASGSQTSLSQSNLLPRRPITETSRWQRGGRVGSYAGSQTSISRLPGRSEASSNTLQQRIRMMTPSVSISPIASRDKKEPIEHLEYYTDSDLSDVDEIEEADEFALHEKQMQQARKLSGPPKQAKSKDVVTISSSSENSDDDCIVLSDPSEAEETDAEEDPSNSGMHTNDRYNVPDDQGRILVNVGHPENEPDVFLAPQIARIIKPHQIGGIRFLYDNIVESIDRYKTSAGFGCILAHSMGLGKTLQVASFCDIFFRCTGAKTVLCIMPINTLQNWLAEFNMWLPYDDPNKPKIEEKPIVKEENQQNDFHSRSGLEREQFNQHQNPQGMMSNQSYSVHPSYNQNLVPQYGPTGGMYDSHYPPTYPVVPGYPLIKSEPSCESHQINPNTNLFGIDNRGVPQYPPNQNYPSSIQHPPNYSSLDPNVHSNMHGMNNQMQSSMYPGYNTQSGTPYANYENQQSSSNSNIKEENDSQQSNQKTENKIGSGTEKIEEPKKETDELKKEKSNDKEEKVIIKTPFSVDAPSDLEIRPRHFNLHILNDSHKTMAARARVIREWQKVGGVLLIGYELYRQLSLKKPNKAKRKRGQPMFKDPSADAEEENKNKPLLDEMHTALVNPGPDLVICDEGHRIKNSHASISMALKQMRTKRRIVLTGYPLQNNLLEYWCMVDFVRPNYLGTKNEFCNMFERPIQNGQCIDSTPQDIRLMRYRAHVLHALLEGFVQRRSHSVLQVSLPRKEEYILLVRMTPHQRKLYDVFMNEVVKKRAVPNPLKAFAVCCKIWNHPDVLYHFLKKRQANEEDDLDLEETIGDKATATGGKRVPKQRQPKAEGKKGKKANSKNKPAASIQPNSTDDNKNINNDAKKQQTYQNFNAIPPPNSEITNFQNPYPPSGYPNYRADDRSNNYQGNEYKDYYANQNHHQNQQKYSPVGGQNYSPYTQNPNYPTNNSTQQHFQGQNQNYNLSINESNNTSRFTGVPPPVSNSTANPPDFQLNQNHAISTSNAVGSFTQSSYSYQDSSKNYSLSSNQDSNCPQISNQPTQQQQQSQQQTAPPQQPDFQNQNQNQSDFGSYPPPNPNPGYNNNLTNQQISNNSINYQSNGTPQQNLNVNLVNVPNTYTNNQQSSNLSTTDTTSYSQNQQLSNPATQSFQNLAPPPIQSNLLIPNQPHQYPINQRENTNPMESSPGVNFDQNQQSSRQPHGAYQANISQNQMGVYHNPSQNQSSDYSQVNSSAAHAFPNDQQQQMQQSQIHQQPHGFNQQTSKFSPPTQQPHLSSGQINYPTNQETIPGSNQISHGYQSNPQQQNSSNQANYSQNDQHGFPGSGSQKVQSYENNYQTASQNTSQNFSTNPSTSQPAVENQQLPPTPMQDHFWQKNYQNSNNPFIDPNINQYQRSYSNNTSMSENYHANQSNQINSQSKDFPVNTPTDCKSSQHMEYGKISENLSSANEAQSIPIQTVQQENNLLSESLYNNSNSIQNNPAILEPKITDADKDVSDKDKNPEKSKEEKSDDEVILKDEVEKDKYLPVGLASAMGNVKEEPGIPYDWAYELMKGYVPGLIDASAKMSLFFCILEEGIHRGDRILTFSQSLFTLNLIEDFLARNTLKHDNGEVENWAKNVNYFRLDGSTSALEREKLINEFNANKKIHLFLVSTRAGSLGINLVGANRAIVFDASWNPCHDTQAVCRVYRYGQQKNCYVYRLVTDNCLERKIYDRQISKQGMADRVVDQCNPDAHLSLKEAATLSWDWEEDSQVQDFSDSKDKYNDEVMRVLLEKYSKLLTKQPFHHESLLVDRKDKKLSQAEKKLARRGYELEKMAANNSRPSYNYIPGNTATRVSVSGGLHIRQIRGDLSGPTSKPVASVRPMQQRGSEGIGPRNPGGTRWIPAEVWQRQGMSAQEMTLPLDVVIPTNSPDKGSIVLKAGQKVMVLKSPKGIYMQLESGKIIAIRTALKINQQKKEDETPKKSITPAMLKTGNSKQDVSFPLRNNSAISIIPKTSTSNIQQNRPIIKTRVHSYRPFGEKEVAKRTKPIATATAKPYSNQMNSNQITLSKINKPKHDNPSDVSSFGENSNSSDGHKVRTDQRVEEVRVEDLVCESGSNSDYSPSSRPSNSDTDSNIHRPIMDSRISNYPIDTSPARSQIIRTPQDSSYISETNTSFSKKFEQNRPGLQKDQKPENEIIGKDATSYHYSNQTFNPHHHLQSHHHVQQPVISQHLQPHSQTHQPQHMSPQQHPTQNSQHHQYQQPTQKPQEHALPSQLQQSHQQQQPTQTYQPPNLHQPHQSQQPRQPSNRNPPRPNIRNSGKNKSAQNSVPPPITGTTSTTSISSKSKHLPSESTSSLATESVTQMETGHTIPQGYPYAQYPRYYDYDDTRPRQPTDAYSYYPPTLPPHTATNLPRVQAEHSQTSQIASGLQPKTLEQPLKSNNDSSKPVYPRVKSVPSKNSTVPETPKIPAPKPNEAASMVQSNTSPSSSNAPPMTREESQVPTAFSHPASVRSSYPAPYPPAPYDPYSQHYPPPSANPAAYTPAAPAGYGAMYGGNPIGYDPEYARMYSAFHGPPPPSTDPYRGYAPPPASHPTNYYSPFPHPPPPPYPNYSFLPPYPNPNVPAEPQPPAP